jgi:uncharacterized metal-binding protein YceD (DUF177 family)
VSETSILSRHVSVAEPPAAPIEIVANEAERKVLAAAYDLVAVKGMSATVGVSPTPGGGVTVEGRVVADIVQTCVVSLAPVDAHIDETFAVRYVRDPGKLPKVGAEVVVDPGAPDPPELLTGPTIDVGEIAEEYFVLAIDPYPHAPGATLPADVLEDAESTEDSPFAALAALAKGAGDKG